MLLLSTILYVILPGIGSGHASAANLTDSARRWRPKIGRWRRSMQVAPDGLLDVSSEISFQTRKLGWDPPQGVVPCGSGQCTSDQFPLLARLASPQNLPAECSKNPPREDLTKPIVEVKTERGIEDAACHFNYFPWCTAAYRAKDYFASVLPVASVQAVYSAEQYDLGEVRTAPGVSPAGAKLCYDNGFLDLPEAMLWNFSLLDEAAQRGCQTLKEQVPSWTRMTMMGMLQSTGQEGSYMPPGAINLTYATKAHLLEHEVWKCAMGHHVLACDMAECLYNYCKLPDGRIGSGKQCRPDWLREDVVESHWKIFEKPPS